MNATSVVREALAETGIDLVASCAIAAYDARAPAPVQSTALLPQARGVVVVGSAGSRLWRAFRALGSPTSSEHPYDAFVSERLDRADAALARAGIRFRRFEAAVHAPIAVDFVALSELVGLGSPGPFGLAIHPVHGPWWALRGAWLVDAEVDAPLTVPRPCVGCAAPCVGGWSNAAGIVGASPETRRRCVVGQKSRYDDAQIAFHYGQEARVETSTEDPRAARRPASG